MTFERIAELYLGSLNLPGGLVDEKPGARMLALERFSNLTPGARNIEAINPDQLRELLSRRYVEESTVRGSRAGVDEAGEIEPAAFLDQLHTFYEWAGENRILPFADGCLRVIAELRQPIPRAIKIGVALSKEIAARGPAATFTEFLTSFEQGGGSRYDIDSPDGRGAVEGYFRLMHVEGIRAEAEEIITGEVIEPIEFPPSTAGLLSEEFVINMEIIWDGRAWQIAGCGFAYPPGTDV